MVVILRKAAKRTKQNVNDIEYSSPKRFGKYFKKKKSKRVMLQEWIDNELVSSSIILMCVSLGIFLVIAVTILLSFHGFRQSDHLYSSKYEEAVEDWNYFKINEDLDMQSKFNNLTAMFHISEAQFNEQLPQFADTHCVKQLHFDMDDDAFDTLVTKLGQLVRCLVNNQTVCLPGSASHHHNIVVSNRGILSDLHSNYRSDKTINQDYGYCPLIQLIYQRFEENGLLIFNPSVIDIQHDYQLFNFTNQEQEHSTLWDMKYKKYFSEEYNVNSDVWSFLSNQNTDDRTGTHVMLHNLLNKYCEYSIPHLSNSVVHSQLVESLIDHVYGHKVIKVKLGEFIYVNDSGHLQCTDIELDHNKYLVRTCPFITKLVHYNPSLDPHEKITDALQLLWKGDNETHHHHNIDAFQHKMDILLEAYCGNVVGCLANEQFWPFLSNLCALSNDLVNRLAHIPAQTRYLVDISTGDILFPHGNDDKDMRHCPLIDMVLTLYGVTTTEADNMDNHILHEVHTDPMDYVEHYDASTYLQDVSHNQVMQTAQKIVKYALKDDVYNLKHIIRSAISFYHSTDIELHYAEGSDLFNEAKENLVTSVEQYVFDLVEHTEDEMHTKHNVVILDCKSSLVVLIPEEDLLKELTQGWVQSALLNSVMDVYAKKLKRDKAKEVESDTKPMMTVDEYAVQLIEDFKEKKANLKEDVVKGLTQYCDKAVSEMDDDKKMLLANNIVVVILKAKKKIEHVVIDEHGYILSFHQVASNSQFSKCKLIETLIKKI